MNQKEILRKIKSSVLGIYPEAEIILYGSRARGDSNKYSDWDILILLKEKINEEEKSELLDQLYDLELEFDQIFSPIIHNTKEWEKFAGTTLYQSVAQEGRVL